MAWRSVRFGQLAGWRLVDPIRHWALLQPVLQEKALGALDPRIDYHLEPIRRRRLPVLVVVGSSRLMPALLVVLEPVLIPSRLRLLLEQERPEHCPIRSLLVQELQEWQQRQEQERHPNL